MPSTARNSSPAGIAAVPAPRPASRRQVWLALAVLALVTLAALWHSLDVPFLLDDTAKIVKNPDIRSLRDLPRTLIYPYDADHPTFNRNDPSRPLVYLSFALNYHFGGEHPRGYHAVNLALHLLAAVLLFFLLRVAARRLFRSASVAAPLCGALLFALHPVNAGTVCYVFCRSDLLAVLCILLSLLLFQVQGRWARPAYAGALVAFALALASKQSAIVLPALALCLDWLLHGGEWRAAVRARFRQHAGLWAVALAYLLLRVVVFSGIGDLEAERLLPRTGYLLIQPYVLLRYVQFLFVPVGLSFVHEIRLPLLPIDPRVLCSLLGLATLSAGVWWLARRGSVLGRTVLFFALWLLIALAPTSSIFPTTSPLVENRLYLPSVAFALLAMALLCEIARGGRRRWLVPAVAVTSIVLFGLVTAWRCTVYREPLRLWGEVVRYYPLSYWGRLALGNEYMEDQQFERAEREYKEAIVLNPNNHEPYVNLGMLYQKTRQYDQAMAAVQTALRLKPDLELGHFMRGFIYSYQGKTEQAIASFEHALAVEPNNLETLMVLATLYEEQERWADAERINLAVLRLAPDDLTAYSNLSFIYWQQRRFPEMERVLLTMLRIDPASVDAYHNLALLYAKIGDTERRQWAEERLRALQGQR